MEHHDSNNHAANKNRAALVEVSFNDSDDQQLPSKRPLLSSTPSLVCRKLQNLPEPSISEISSLSFDELHQPTENNNSAPSLKNVKECDHTPREKTSQQLPNPDISSGERAEGEEDAVVEERAGYGERVKRKEGSEAEAMSAQASRGFGCVFTPSPLESLAEDLKER